MRVSIIGLGTVGQGVVELLERHRALFAERCGCECTVVAALVRDASRPRERQPAGALVTSDIERFFGVPSEIMVEVAGGIHPARELCERALNEGRDLVSANKALLAAHGPELFALAEKRRRRVLFEAAVAGGVPIIRMLTDSLASGRVRSIAGIVNGTCNFILSEMSRGGSYAEALRSAQDQGFAEADPTLDVSGDDSLQKLCLLASLAFGRPVTTRERGQIESSGIMGLTAADLDTARRAGGTIKLIAHARSLKEDAIAIHNGPMFVPDVSPLSRVSGSHMGVQIETDSLRTMFLGGDGAGRYPTASAVVADVLEAARLHGSRGVRPLNRYPAGSEPPKIVRIESRRVAGVPVLE